jgi:hypothetical protein
VRAMIFACDLNSGTLLPFEESDKKDGRPDGEEVKKAAYGAADGDESQNRRRTLLRITNRLPQSARR